MVFCRRNDSLNYNNAKIPDECVNRIQEKQTLDFYRETVNRIENGRKICQQRKKNTIKIFDISEEDIPEAQEFRDKPEYYTCRNWQFANKIKNYL